MSSMLAMCRVKCPSMQLGSLEHEFNFLTARAGAAYDTSQNRLVFSNAPGLGTSDFLLIWFLFAGLLN